MALQSVNLIQTPNYKRIKQNFLNEIILASEKKPSSISFIKHAQPSKPLLNHGIVQGIVIGGTNYILLSEKINRDGSKKLISKQTGKLPLFTNRERFAKFFADNLDPHADAIGINFGFKLKSFNNPDGSLDGIIIAKGTKDHTFSGINESVGLLVKKIFYDKYHKNSIVSVANDTVCLLLSGKGNENMSLVAGTGFNMGIRLKKDDQMYLVNLETGGFDKFPKSPILKAIDATTKNQGKKLFEKIISGQYLAIYFNEKIKELKLQITPILTSQELSEFSHEEHTDLTGDLARAIIIRSAYLVAAAIAGVYEFITISGYQTHASPLVVIGEGSLLWDGWRYNENIRDELLKLGLTKNDITIKHIKDSSINGAIGLITK